MVETPTYWQSLKSTVARRPTLPTTARDRNAKDRQISVRIARETDAWSERRAGSNQNKARFIRQLIERERAREREQELLEMFNAAALDVTDEDIEERESLLGGFAGGGARIVYNPG